MIKFNSKDVYKIYKNGSVVNKIDDYVSGNTPTSRLPEGYTEVEYIRQSSSTIRHNSSNKWTVPINNMVSGDSFTIIFSMDSTGQNGVSRYISIFGSDEVFAIRQDSGYGYNLNTKYFTNANTARGNYTMEYDTKLSFNYKPSLITVTNVTTGVQTLVNLSQSSGYNPSGELGVYGYWYGGTAEYLMKGNVYEIKIEGTDETIKYNYIPCKRDSDNKVGLYDIVNNVFASPSGFTITAGQEVTPTGTTSESKAVFQYLTSGDTPTPLPYDAEIEYLESSGGDNGQYINTGLYLNTSNFEVGYETLSERLYWGYTSQGNGGGTWLGIEGTTVFFGSFANRFTASTINSSNNVIKYASQSGVTANGTFTSKNFSLGSNSIANTPLYIFGRYDFRNSVVDTNAVAKLKSFYLKNNGELVLDMIPVRVGQVGYMYDKVSGQLFGNDGTGSFILGNDVQ